MAILGSRKTMFVATEAENLEIIVTHSRVMGFDGS